jgi:hypothetical protein
MKYLIILIICSVNCELKAQEITILENQLIYNNKKYELKNVEKACLKNKTINNKICNFITKNKNKELVIEDPLLGNIQYRTSYDIYGQIGLFGSLKGYSLNFIKQYEKMGIGFFGSNLKVKNQYGDYILGYAYGGSLRYNIINNAVLDEKNILLPGMFLNIGQAKIKSSVQGVLPSYIYGEAGLDIAYRIQTLKNSKIDAFIRISTQEIYNQQSGLLNLGNQISIGLKIGF